MVLSDSIQNIFGRLLPVSDRPARRETEQTMGALPRTNSSFRISVQRGPRGPVGIITLTGGVDNRNYEQLMDKARELWDGGVVRIVIDASEAPGLGLSCIYALHAMARMAGNKSYPASELGWSALRRLCEANLAEGLQDKVVLVGDTGGHPDFFSNGAIDQLFPIFTSLDSAIAFRMP